MARLHQLVLVTFASFAQLSLDRSSRYSAVSTSPDPDILRFNDKGDGIVVSKDGAAVCNLLQKAGMDYKKWDTVVRQLNYWRFKRSEQTDGRKKRNRLEGSHQLFE